jgi:Haemolysin-III related
MTVKSMTTMERSPIGTMLPDKIAALPKSAGTFARGCLHKYASPMTTPFTWDYDRGETVADAVIHILGIAIAIGGAAVLTVIAVHQGDIREVTAVAIYLVGFLAMIGFSAAYNLWPVSPLKWWLRRLDHSAIYLLIAATYTAFMLPMHGMTPALCSPSSGPSPSPALRSSSCGPAASTAPRLVFISRWAGAASSRSAPSLRRSHRSRYGSSAQAACSIRWASSFTPGAACAFRMRSGTASC